MVFDAISSNTDKVLLMNPSANKFVFGDFKVHHKDWLMLTYSGGTARLAELYYNCSVSKELMVNFPTHMQLTVTNNPALLNLILSYGTRICSTMAFLLL